MTPQKNPSKLQFFFLLKPFPPKPRAGPWGGSAHAGAGHPGAGSQGVLGGQEGGRGSVPLRGVAVTQRALFFAGERDRHPEGGNTGRGIARQARAPADSTEAAEREVGGVDQVQRHG